MPAEIIDDPSSSALSSDCSDPSCSSGDGDSPDGTPAVVRHRHSRHQELFQSEPNLDVSTTADKRHEKRKEGQQHSSAKITTGDYQCKLNER